MFVQDVFWLYVWVVFKFGQVLYVLDARLQIVFISAHVGFAQNLCWSHHAWFHCVCSHYACTLQIVFEAVLCKLGLISAVV